MLLAFAVASALPYVHSSDLKHPGCRDANCTKLDLPLKVTVSESGYGTFFQNGQANYGVTLNAKAVADLGCFLVSATLSPVTSVPSTPVSFAHAIRKDIFRMPTQKDVTELPILMFSVFHESRGHRLSRIKRQSSYDTILYHT